jgi:hypothetical protein
MKPKITPDPRADRQYEGDPAFMNLEQLEKLGRELARAREEHKQRTNNKDIPGE